MKKFCSLFLTLALVLGLLPTSVLAVEEPAVPFAALAGEELAVVKSGEGYTYTETDWTTMESEQRTVDLYVVTVPAGAETVTLDFGAELRLAYGYTAAEEYVAAYGEYGDGTTGQTAAEIAQLPDFVRVQTPYDASWNSELLYAVAFETTQSEPEQPGQSEVSADALLANIAAGYVEDSSQWIILDMAAYEVLMPETQSKTSETAKQSYIDAAIAAISAEGAGETAYSVAALALQAIGADPQKLYPEDSETSVSAIEGLKNIAEHSASAWTAPYTLAAFNQGHYGTDETEQAIISSLLANQAEDGSWSEWGDSIQTTANMIAGLSFYYGQDKTVTAAVDKAVAYLSSVQKEDGSFDAYGSGADANTAAMVVVGLAAVGVDPDADSRFVKNGGSALDALLSFALSDNSGFGYTDNTALNSYSTEQGFRALIAASQVMENGAAYNIYDFSANEVAPAYAGGKPADEDQGGSGGGSSDDEITVSFELKTHSTTWIDAHDVTVDEDATVADVFYQVLDSREEFSFVESNGYISSITNGDATWAEFDAGRNSGWKYMVNGVAPSVGMTDTHLEDGDEIVWYYVTDYRQDTDRDEDRHEEEEPVIPEMTFTDVAGHWAGSAIGYCYAEGLMSGTGGDTFAPDLTVSRAMLVTILYAMEDKPETEGEKAFADVAADTWYTDAVLWCAEQGLVSGYDNGGFGPADNVTREQLAAILWQYAKLKGEDVSVGEDTNILSYHDAFAVSDWAFSALQWACGAGLMGGYDGALMPQGQATRAEVATILMNYLENIA